MRRMLMAMAALGVSASAAAAGWEEDLAAQMRFDHDCKVTFFSGVVERQVEGKLVVFAKAHCEDGRTFDAVQHDEFEDFEVRECTPDQPTC